ncbi:MAG: hypothetical protein HY825_05380 [Acidobacteria bacterium]|nr:hypothetical protein [Acidobacteriota bacterium]
MRSAFAWPLLTLALTACTTTSVHRDLASEPTPSIWKPDATWVLVLLDDQSQVVRSLTVRFTDQAADSCISGDWRQVEILAERPARHPSFTGKSAYMLTGAALVVELSANRCDSYYTLHGRLSETGVAGAHGPQHLQGGRAVGTFSGAPTDQ